MSIKLAGFAPWKMGVGKNHDVFMLMEKFGILTLDDFSASAEHFLKFALTEGIDGEETLAFLLPRIQIYPKKKINFRNRVEDIDQLLIDCCPADC